jgi:hypothetical protein
MSFLIQTDDEFIKIQLRSLLLDSKKKKEIKKNLKKIGLYSNRFGFRTYRNFFDVELARRFKTNRTKPLESNLQTQKSSHKKAAKSELPSIRNRLSTLKKFSI